MKARFYPIVLSLALAVVALTSTRGAAAPATFTFVDPDDPAATQVLELGDRTINQLGNALILEVRRVLAKSSPALAIGMLHLKDYKLPLSRPGQPVITAVRRTSLRVRNPANSPDIADQAALDLIMKQLQDGEDVARVLVQRVTLPGQPPEWRVYRPLAALNQCLDCHGKESALAPGVADTLKVFFPADKAVDYKPGEWRGLIRVSIQEPAKTP
jgi:hypothetical protein